MTHIPTTPPGVSRSQVHLVKQDITGIVALLTGVSDPAKHPYLWRLAQEYGTFGKSERAVQQVHHITQYTNVIDN